LEVTDGTATTAQSFSIVVANTNDAPTFDSAPVTAATEDSAYSYSISTSDVDGDPRTITATTLPTWLTLTDNGDGTATLSGTPTNAEVGSHAVVLEVTDGTAITTQSFSIVVANTNDAPTFDSAPVTAATEDSAYSYSIATTDVDGDPRTITATTLPTWLTLTDNGDGTATLSGTPTNAEVGSHAVVLEVTDGTAITTQSFSIVVVNTNDAPTFDSAPVTAATEDAAYSYAIATTDVDGDPRTITATTLPTWLTLTDNGDGSATLSGTPTNAEVGSHAIVLEVTDGTATTIQSFSIVVANTNDAPVFTSPVSFTVAENTTTVGTLTSADNDGAAPTYSLVGSTDDSRFSLDAATGQLRFTTAPDFENPADNGANNTYDLTVQVSDGNGGMATQNIQVTVTNVNETPVFGSPTSFTLSENSSSVAMIASTDDSGSTQRYSLVGTEDDNLFNIDPTTGLLSFSAAPNFESPADTDSDNTYNLTVQVEDGTGLSATLGVAVNITNVNEAPILNTLELSASEGFSGTIGQLSMTDPDAGDELTLTIVGGSAQAFFSVDPNTGAINQQSTLAAGLYTLEVQLNDANGMSTRATLQIRIDPSEPDLGAADNTDENTVPDSNLVDATGDYSHESSYAPLKHGIDSLVDTGIDAIGDNGNITGLNTADSPEESSLQAPSSSSAVGENIDTLFPAHTIQTHHIGAASSHTEESGRSESSGRGYSVVLELLFGEAEEAFDELGNSLASIMGASQFSITLTPDMLNALLSMHRDVDAQQQQADERLELILTAGTVASVTLTVGFVSWLLQTGSLLATALSTSPLWRAIDPIPVLVAGKDGEENEHPQQPRTGTHH
jgi:VCBS repeat-containing protein